MTTPTDTAASPIAHDDPTDSSRDASTVMPTDAPTLGSAAEFGSAQPSAASAEAATSGERLEAAPMHGDSTVDSAPPGSTSTHGPTSVGTSTPDSGGFVTGQPGATYPNDGTTAGTGAPGTPPPGWPGAAPSPPYQSWSPWVVPGAPERRMRRSRTDRMLAGVCGGIAEYTGIDPVLVRLAFLTSLLFGGIGILFYLAAMLIMPKPLP